MSEEYSFPVDVNAIPETWDGVKSFADWWCRNGMPMAIPAGSRVYVTDNAASIAVFRRGQFQAELYLIHPKTPLPEHGHPGVDVVQMRLDINLSPKSGPFVVGDIWAAHAPVLRQGKSHSGGSFAMSGEGGMLLIAFEHWLDAEPTSAAVAWSGYTVGPIHEELIREYYPDSFVESGYADISKPSNYRQILGGKK